MQTKLLTLSSLILAASLSSQALAVTILGADRYLGPSTGNGNDHLNELNALIVTHNSSSDSLHAIHTTIPTPVPSALGHFIGNSDVGDVKDPLQFVLQSGHTWLGFKAGTNLGFYYLGGLTVGDTLQFQTTFQQGVSNWSTYGGDVPNNNPPCEDCPRVPDNGVTFLLLGAGLTLLGFVRRFIK